MWILPAVWKAGSVAIFFMAIFVLFCSDHRLILILDTILLYEMVHALKNGVGYVIHILFSSVFLHNTVIYWMPSLNVLVGFFPVQFWTLLCFLSEDNWGKSELAVYPRMAYTCGGRYTATQLTWNHQSYGPDVGQILLKLSRDRSVVRASDSSWKGCGFKSHQECQKNFLLQCQLSVPTLILVSVPPPCYPSSM